MRARELLALGKDLQLVAMKTENMWMVESMRESMSKVAMRVYVMVLVMLE